MSQFRLDDELVGLHGEEAAARAMVEIGMAPDEAKALAHKRATTIPIWEPFPECDTSNPPPEVLRRIQEENEALITGRTPPIITPLPVGDALKDEPSNNSE